MHINLELAPHDTLDTFSSRCSFYIYTVVPADALVYGDRQHTFTCIHTYIHTYIHEHVDIDMIHTNTHVMYVCMCVCIKQSHQSMALAIPATRTRLHTHMLTYIHTCIHKQKLKSYSPIWRQLF
jgi:hypothetical protein